MNVICFGNSNTYGYDPRSYLGGRYDADSRWVDILAAKTGWTVRNMGENGREIPTLAPDFPADTDLLIVMIGTNDLILDVREQDEYDSGHIPGAVLLPVGSIDEDTAAEVIPEKDSTILVYCRSGNRSKTASSALAELGYTNIYEFGGINTWPYEIES